MPNTVESYIFVGKKFCGFLQKDKGHFKLMDSKTTSPLPKTKDYSR